MHSVGILVRANVPVYPQERAMSTSPVYDSIRAALQQHLPSVIDSQIDSVGLAIVGAVVSMSSQMAKIARAMPLDTTELAKEQRLRRLLDNARLTQTDHYQPIVQHALHGLKGQRVQLRIDRVLLRDQHHILVVRVGSSSGGDAHAKKGKRTKNALREREIYATVLP